MAKKLLWFEEMLLVWYHLLKKTYKRGVIC